MEQDAAYDKLKSNQERSAKAKNVLRGAGYARGGGVGARAKEKHSDEAEDKKLIKKEVSKAKIRFADGGKVDGGASSANAGKTARGGSKPRGHAGKTHININVGAGQAEKQAAMQQGVQVGAHLAAQKMAGAARPMAGAPMQARPPMAPLGGGMPPGAGGPPPGGPPMQARGGRTYAKGGAVGAKRATGSAKLTDNAGAGGGAGRLAKARTYGTKPKG